MSIDVGYVLKLIDEINTLQSVAYAYHHVPSERQVFVGVVARDLSDDTYDEVGAVLDTFARSHRGEVVLMFDIADENHASELPYIEVLQYS
jgi:hypothetical protein